MNLDFVVYQGRPESTRSPREDRVYDLLDKLNIAYRRVDHPATASIEACAGVDKVLGIHICKNLFLCNAQKTRFYLLMMPGDKAFHTKDLSHQIGSSRLSFAPPEYMEKYLDLFPGSVSVLGLMNDSEKQVTLLVDRDVFHQQMIGCHPCVNTSSLAIAGRDIFEVFLPAVEHTYTIVDL